MNKTELDARVARLEQVNSTLWVALGLGAIVIAGLSVVAFPKTHGGHAEARPAAPGAGDFDHSIPLAARKAFAAEPMEDSERNYEAIQQLYRNNLLTSQERDDKVRLLNEVSTADVRVRPSKEGLRRQRASRESVTTDRKWLGVVD